MTFGSLYVNNSADEAKVPTGRPDRTVIVRIPESTFARLNTLENMGGINRTNAILDGVIDLVEASTFDSVTDSFDQTIGAINRTAKKTKARQKQFDSCGSQGQPCRSAPNSRHEVVP